MSGFDGESLAAEGGETLLLLFRTVAATDPAEIDNLPFSQASRPLLTSPWGGSGRSALFLEGQVLRGGLEVSRIASHKPISGP